MGFLVGLPLGIFRLLFGFLMLALRLVVPIVVIGAVVMLYRRSKGARAEQPRRQKNQEPEFRGPVYTVDYEEVDDDGTH